MAILIVSRVWYSSSDSLLVAWIMSYSAAVIKQFIVASISLYHQDTQFDIPINAGRRSSLIKTQTPKHDFILICLICLFVVIFIC